MMVHIHTHKRMVDLATIDILRIHHPPGNHRVQARLWLVLNGADHHRYQR